MNESQNHSCNMSDVESIATLYPFGMGLLLRTTRGPAPILKVMVRTKAEEKLCVTGPITCGGRDGRLEKVKALAKFLH